MTAKSCFLQCLKNAAKKIPLPHNQTIHIGRSETTLITDTCLSRKQVALTANYDNYTVTVKTLGTNYSGCNGYALMKDETYNLHHGDHLELRLGFHEFIVTFDPPPENYVTGEPETKKPKLYSIFNVMNQKNSSNQNVDFETLDYVPGKWEEIDNGALLIHTSDNIQSKSKIAAFDLDGTLIRTKSGGAFAKNADDWTLNLPNVKSKLNELYIQGYKIVIFTNQAGIGLEKVKPSEFYARVEGVIKSLAIPVQVFGATSTSIYRKPISGMWDILCREKNDNIEVDIANSFFVGDAAGRKKDWAPKRKSDISCGDRLFALNIGLKFYTPEEYFSEAPSAPFTMPTFDPRTVSVIDHKPSLSNEQEIVLMVGIQGSGKSHYCKNYLVPNGYVYINRDTLGSRCVKTTEEALKQKQSVVVDNTNPDQNARKTYVELAKKYNVPCRCFLMATSFDQAKHNNRFRELTDKNHSKIGIVLFHSFKKNFQEPTLEEGFKDVVKIDFIPKFNNPDEEKLYKMYLLEK